jgi:hypothetical protein
MKIRNNDTGIVFHLISKSTMMLGFLVSFFDRKEHEGNIDQVAVGVR